MKAMKRLKKKIFGSMLLLCCLVMTNLQVYAANASAALVEIEAYEVTEGVLKAGEQITLNMTVTNTSSVSGAQNVVLTYTATNDLLYPVYGEDNQVYVGSIPAGQSRKVSITMMVSDEYHADYAKVNFSIDYLASDGSAANNVTINIPTYVSGQLVSEYALVSENATQNVNTLVSIICKNTGSTDISDAVLVLEGNVDDECARIELPTIGAGKTYSQDYFARFTQSGIQTLNVSYEYTDAEGAEHVVNVGEYKVNVITGASADDGDIVVVEETTSTATVVTQVLLLAVSFAVVLAVLVIYFRKKK